MGCKGSRASPVSPVNKCLREGCEFARHTQQDHGYCCNLCRQNGQHGPLCQKQRSQTTPGDHTNPPTTPGAVPAGSAAAPDRVALTWTPSLLFGPDGRGLQPEAATSGVTATETMHLVRHKGELFAAFGKWMSSDKAPMKNFVGRLSSPGGCWQVDMRGQGLSEHAMRFTCLKSVTWTRDCHGNELRPPVEQLVLTYGLGKHGNMMMFRNDAETSGAQHLWSETNYTGPCPNFANSGTARAVLIHRDTVTGIERLFSLKGPDGVVSGVYDPSSNTPGHVVFDKKQEALDLSQMGNGRAKILEFRPLSLVIANGKLYMSSASWILQRIDGPQPVWRGVLDIAQLRSANGPLNEAVGGIRGMTAISCPTDPTKESILFCWNPNDKSESWILRTDSGADGALQPPVEETSIRRLAKSYLGTQDLHYTLAAYNNMLPASLGSPCHLIGFEIYLGEQAKVHGRDPNQKGFWAGGGFAVRVAENDYYVLEVGGRGSKVQRPLTAVRCFEVSPFPEEEGSIYFGGYDCNSFKSNHTAWIYKGALQK
ncbi:Uncharacterized protein SCF082_LOCUS14825 [Durusdinium trenchii]|uniref:Uncharacterized protein n=1 Tax=Durusdinium trenchii TaxID=1381693 RepID=A0ABP0K0C2_9DINO